ncbi:MAG: hypothetical protein LBT59_23190 [Clostridiales bacterium]|jgi:hypothetical protein|nr:hypothetical protein [Clostridiales bacterium]
MIRTLDFTQNITNPYVQFLCDEIKMPFDHELMLMLEKVSEEKNVSITNLIRNCIYRYLLELGEVEDIEKGCNQHDGLDSDEEQTP